MKLRCLFILRHGENNPELLLAWDEYSIDGHESGFKQDCEDALKQLDDVRASSIIDVNVHEQTVMGLLVPSIPPMIDGRIKKEKE